MDKYYISVDIVVVVVVIDIVVVVVDDVDVVSLGGGKKVLE